MITLEFPSYHVTWGRPKAPVDCHRRLPMTRLQSRMVRLGGSLRNYRLKVSDTGFQQRRLFAHISLLWKYTQSNIREAARFHVNQLAN